MRLNVLICCYNDSLQSLPSILMPPRPDVRYVVSHQISLDYSGKAMPEEIVRPDVVYAQFSGKGLSLNRNHCLDTLRGCALQEDEICLIADDDVTYGPESFDRVLSAFRDNPAIDIAAFRIRTPDGQPPFKNYPDEPFAVKKIPLWGEFYFSSVEIAFRLDSVGDLRFDEDFGVGARKWPEGGEEAIFLSDCLKRGLKMKYFPEYIVGHEFMSTGKARKTIRKARMMLAVACRCRGIFSQDAFVGLLRVVYRVVTYPLGKL